MERNLAGIIQDVFDQSTVVFTVSLGPPYTVRLERESLIVEDGWLIGRTPHKGMRQMLAIAHIVGIDQ